MLTVSHLLFLMNRHLSIYHLIFLYHCLVSLFVVGAPPLLAHFSFREKERQTRERGGQESYSVMSLSELFNEPNTCMNSSDVRKTTSTAVPGWLKGFAKKQKIGGRSSVASSDAVPHSAAVRAPVDMSAVHDYFLDAFIKNIAGLVCCNIQSETSRLIRLC